LRRLPLAQVHAQPGGILRRLVLLTLFAEFTAAIELLPAAVAIGRAILRLIKPAALSAALEALILAKLLTLIEPLIVEPLILGILLTSLLVLPELLILAELLPLAVLLILVGSLPLGRLVLIALTLIPLALAVLILILPLPPAGGLRAVTRILSRLRLTARAPSLGFGLALARLALARLALASRRGLIRSRLTRLA
jgi:hypothetical protein